MLSWEKMVFQTHVKFRVVQENQTKLNHDISKGTWKQDNQWKIETKLGIKSLPQQIDTIIRQHIYYLGPCEEE